MATKSAEKAYKEWLKDCPSGTYSRGGYNYKNTTLIKLLNITEEEERQLETIIDKKEVKRRTNKRTNEYHKSQRRNENGLTKREQQKFDKERYIKELLLKGLNKTQIAKEIGISRQKLYSIYGYLF